MSSWPIYYTLNFTYFKSPSAFSVDKREKLQKVEYGTQNDKHTLSVVFDHNRYFFFLQVLWLGGWGIHDT